MGLSKTAHEKKLRRMLEVLNANEKGRVYRIKPIDMVPSGYYEIDRHLDVEICVSVVKEWDTASIWLWQSENHCCTCYDNHVIAVRRDVPFDEIDGVVGEWVEQIKKKELPSYAESYITREQLYSRYV